MKKNHFWRAIAVVALAVFVRDERGQSVPTDPWLWARHIGGSTGIRVVVDGAANSYVLGEFMAGYGTGTIGGSALSARTNQLRITFLAKYDGSGTFRWVRQFAAADMSIQLDSGGDVLLAGTFDGTITIGNVTLISAPEKAGVFLTRYDTSGSQISARVVGTTASVSNVQIAVDGKRNYYLAGKVRDHILLPNGPGNYFGTERGADVFVAKYNQSGTPLWLSIAGGKDDDYSTGVAFDNIGNCYVMGELGESLADFSPGVGWVGRDTRLTFVAKLNLEGSFEWVKKIETSQGLGSPYGTLAVDTASNVYVARNFRGAATIETTTLSSTSSDDFLITKFDGQGNLIWARKGGMTGTFLSEIRGIALDKRGDLYLTGYFGLPVSMSATPSNDPFPIVRKYSSKGDLLGEFGAGKAVSGNAVALDLDNNVYVAGVYTTNASLGGTRLTGADVVAAFVAKAREITTVVEGFTSIRVTGPKEVRVSVEGKTGERFRIETSTNLIDWIPLIDGVSGHLEFSDSPSSRTPSKFFRFTRLP
ncbi:MAG: hypothetical protein HY735_25305 [Verrucomicrobia bacterium]|nr:hypothetical protein [Verrucomicrobiota bacterium]